MGQHRPGVPALEGPGGDPRRRRPLLACRRGGAGPGGQATAGLPLPASLALAVVPLGLAAVLAGGAGAGQRQFQRGGLAGGRGGAVAGQGAGDRRGADTELLPDLLLGPARRDQRAGPLDGVRIQRRGQAGHLDHRGRAVPPERGAQPADRAWPQPERRSHIIDGEPHLRQRHDRQVPRPQVCPAERAEQHHAPVGDHQLRAFAVGVHRKLRAPLGHPGQQPLYVLHRAAHGLILPGSARFSTRFSDCGRSVSSAQSLIS